MDESKFFIIYKDYLPEGLTWEKLEQLAEAKKAKPLTKETLAEIVDPKFLDITEDDFIEYLKQIFPEDGLPKHYFGQSQPHLAYAEDLDKNDELNQDFPEIKDE